MGYFVFYFIVFYLILISDIESKYFVVFLIRGREVSGFFKIVWLLGGRIKD